MQVVADVLHGRVDLVRDAACQRAQGLELLCLLQVLFKLACPQCVVAPAQGFRDQRGEALEQQRLARVEDLGHRACRHQQVGAAPRLHACRGQPVQPGRRPLADQMAVHRHGRQVAHQPVRSSCQVVDECPVLTEVLPPGRVREALQILPFIQWQQADAVCPHGLGQLLQQVERAVSQVLGLAEAAQSPHQHLAGQSHLPVALVQPLHLQQRTSKLGLRRHLLLHNRILDMATFLLLPQLLGRLMPCELQLSSAAQVAGDVGEEAKQLLLAGRVVVFLAQRMEAQEPFAAFSPDEGYRHQALDAIRVQELAQSVGGGQRLHARDADDAVGPVGVHPLSQVGQRHSLAPVAPQSGAVGVPVVRVAGRESIPVIGVDVGSVRLHVAAELAQGFHDRGIDLFHRGVEVARGNAHQQIEQRGLRLEILLEFAHIARDQHHCPVWCPGQRCLLVGDRRP